MKIGVIGFGGRASGVLKCLKEYDRDLSIAGVVDHDPDLRCADIPAEQRAALPRFGSVDDLVRLGKPDAVMIGTRCDTHTPMAIEMAKYDLPLFLEKPVSHSLDQALALESAFQKSNCRVLVGFPLRTSILCRKAKDLLDHGAAGRVEHVMAVNYCAYGNVYFETQYRDYPVTQGLFLQKATHDLDYLAYLVGAPITRVAAMHSLGRVYRDRRHSKSLDDPYAIYLDEIGTPETGMNEDSSSALLEFANGVKGVYTQIFYSKRAPRRGATLSGVKGLVEFDWYQGQVKAISHQESFNTVLTSEGDEDHWGGDAELAQNFVAMVKEGAPSIAPIKVGLESVYACLAAKESAETGRFVNVRQV